MAKAKTMKLKVTCRPCGYDWDFEGRSGEIVCPSCKRHHGYWLNPTDVVDLKFEGCKFDYSAEVRIGANDDG